MSKTDDKNIKVEAEVIDSEIVDETSEVLDTEVLGDEGVEPKASGRVLELKDSFTTLQDRSYETSKKLAEDISMLELDEAKEMITDAIQQLEEFAGANQAVSIGFFGRISTGLLALPGAKTIAGAVGAIKDEAEKQKIATGSIKDAAEKLFSTLENKQNVLEKTTYSVMEIEGRREVDIVALEEMKIELEDIINDPSTDAREVFQAKNMLIQVKEAIIQSKTKVDQVAIIIETAQASTFAITSLLPKIKNNFLDDLTIGTGLNHLLQYKSMFDETMTLVNNIEEHNFKKINQAMLDVVDLTITTANTDRLASQAKEREEGRKKLVAKTTEQINKQNESIAVLTQIENNTLALGSRQEAALIGSTNAGKTDKKTAK